MHESKTMIDGKEETSCSFNRWLFVEFLNVKFQKKNNFFTSFSALEACPSFSHTNKLFVLYWVCWDQLILLPTRYLLFPPGPLEGSASKNSE